MKKEEAKQSVKDTGHEWDGIKELDNPDPLWLRYTFYIAVFVALLYWMLYPSWPSPGNDGILGWSSPKEVITDLQQINKVRAVYQEEFDKMSFDDIYSNPQMMKFALAGGQSTFINNCAVCHGVGGGGNVGYPNLTAGAWLWGGKTEDIYTTLKYGIRSPHPESRESLMAAFGRDKILKSQEIEQLVIYVKSLRGGTDQSSAAHQLYMDNCAACHGDKGQGGREFGAPTLNDAIWLYGSDSDTIYDVIYNGRGGQMPYWEGKLSDSNIRQVAIYVHELGGGE